MPCVSCTYVLGLPYEAYTYATEILSLGYKCEDLSYYLWGCSLLIVSGTTMKNILHADASVGFLLLIAILVLVVCLVQFAVGRHIGHYFNSTINAGQALGQKNTAFAIWIAYTYMNPLSTVGPGCYILWQNIINSIEIWYYDHTMKRKN